MNFCVCVREDGRVLVEKEVDEETRKFGKANLKNEKFLGRFYLQLLAVPSKVPKIMNCDFLFYMHLLYTYHGQLCKCERFSKPISTLSILISCFHNWNDSIFQQIIVSSISTKDRTYRTIEVFITSVPELFPQHLEKQSKKISWFCDFGNSLLIIDRKQIIQYSVLIF